MFAAAVLALILIVLPGVHEVLSDCRQQRQEALNRQEEELERLRLIEAAHKRVLLQTAKILSQLEEVRKQKGE